MPGRVVTWALVGLVVAAPTAIGGVHPTTQVILSAAALLIALLHFGAGDGRPRVEPFVVAALLGLGWTLVQLVPLPAMLVSWLSPGAYEARVGVLPPGGSPHWMPLTLDVPATLLEVCKGLALCALLLVASGVGRSLSRAHRLVMAIAVFGGGLTLVAGLHRLMGWKTLLFGLYVPEGQPGSGYFGTFVAANHAGAMFALSALCGLGLFLELDGPRRLVAGVSSALSFCGVLMTTSRSAALGLAAGMLLFVSVRLVRRWGTARGLLAAVALLLIATTGTLWAAEGLRSRLVPRSSDELWENQKVRGWRAGMALAQKYVWTGVGRGAFEAPVMAVRHQDEGVRLVYPENVVVQLAAEWGLPAALAIFLWFGRGVRRLRPGFWRLEPSTLGAACGVVAVVAHELADFALEMPGVSIPTVVALGVVIGRSQERLLKTAVKAQRTPLLPPQLLMASAVVWLLALGGGAWAARHTLNRDWDRAASALQLHSPDAELLLQTAVVRHPSSSYLALLAAEERLAANDGRGAMRQLNRTLYLQPSNLLAHRLAGRLLSRSGYSSQAALEYQLSSDGGKVVLYPEIIRALGPLVLDAVPQRPDDLLRLAVELGRAKRPKLSHAANRRAVELGEGRVEVLKRWVEVAVRLADVEEMKTAADALIESAPDVDGYIQAAQALVAAGDPAAADAAVLRGLVGHPAAPALAIYGAQRRMDSNDLSGARLLLRRTPEAALTLRDRKAMEELSAQLSDREGDPSAAILARTRARMLSQKLETHDR